MNAFPPTQYVTKGAYRIFHHPIYVGFCLLTAGVSLIANSPSGFYIITPVVCLLCMALVLGYERWDLKKRFGNSSHITFFGLPTAGAKLLSFSEKVGVFCSAFLVWFLLYELLILLGVDESYINTMSVWEQPLPVVEWAEIPYAFTYFFIGSVPFILRTTSDARSFLIQAWLITACGLFLQFILPFYSEARSFTASTALGELILLERKLDGPAAAFPSFHVLWTLLAVSTWNVQFPKMKIIFYGIGFAIVLSCIFTGIHSIADVVAGLLLYFLIQKRSTITSRVQQVCEHLANSWRAWQFEQIRIINHSIYAGIAAMAGVLIAFQFGVDPLTMIIIIVSSVVGGVTWGQLIEGSSKLLRPFGYFGALIGGVVGLIATKVFFGINIIPAFAALALAAPWTQALGRLRCLVQGCCHGRKTENNFGIRYFNEHSRVCKIAGLKGQFIHNTQLYAIIFNVVIGMVLLRLWFGGSSPALITGFYFMLSGIARFIEEAYRGETQTKKIGGLSLYQWLSIASVLSGILFSTYPSDQQLSVSLSVDPPHLAIALFAGIVWAFGMGIDFPKSSIRFSRLTG